MSRKSEYLKDQALSRIRSLEQSAASNKEIAFMAWLDRWEPGIAFWFGFVVCFGMISYGLNLMLRKAIIFLSALFN